MKYKIHVYVSMEGMFLSSDPFTLINSSVYILSYNMCSAFELDESCKKSLPREDCAFYGLGLDSFFFAN